MHSHFPLRERCSIHNKQTIILPYDIVDSDDEKQNIYVGVDNDLPIEGLAIDLLLLIFLIDPTLMLPAFVAPICVIFLKYSLLFTS